MSTSFLAWPYVFLAYTECRGAENSPPCRAHEYMFAAGSNKVCRLSSKNPIKYSAVVLRAQATFLEESVSHTKHAGRAVCVRLQRYFQSVFCGFCVETLRNRAPFARISERLCVYLFVSQTEIGSELLCQSSEGRLLAIRNETNP